MTWVALGRNDAWTLETHLLAGIHDALVWANYQRGDGKGAKPQPMDRPADIKSREDQADRHAARAQRFLDRTKGVPR